MKKGEKMTESFEMVKLAVAALNDKKAEDIKVIDISDISIMADYFIITSGNNPNQIQAMCENVKEKLGRAGCEYRQIEGYDTASWILMDYRDMIVHIFDRESRSFYNLERIWSDGKSIEV